MGKNGWTKVQLDAKDDMQIENHLSNGHTEPLYRVMHGAGSDPRPIFVTYTVGKPGKSVLDMRQRDTKGKVKVVRIYP
jgi:hypothetical protein